MTVRAASLLAITLVFPAAAQDRTVKVDLAYRSPETKPGPNFSPYGMQVKLTALDSGALPEGASAPAKTGVIPVGPNQNSWIKLLVTADPAHPSDLTRLYLDKNRDGDFTNDGPPIVAAVTQNDKTKAWWSNFANAELTIPYGNGVAEPYAVTFWAVREGEAAPEVIRYSVRSWRSGSIAVGQAQALVAVMDSDNNAIFDAKDMWSVLGANETDAAKRVLSIGEARSTNRLMFLSQPGAKELVLEFRGLTPDGRSLTFAVVNRPVTKAEDRAPDDTLSAERSRPRTKTAFPWIEGNLDRALAEAKSSGRKVLIDFWATWCGPCKSLDEWIWSDAEVAAVLNANYIGLKLDADVEKALVQRFHVEGYPTLIILDATGKELRRFGYLPSKQMMTTL